MLWGEINTSQERFNRTSPLLCVVFHGLASAMQVPFRSVCSYNEKASYLLQVPNPQKRCPTAHSPCSLCRDPSAQKTRSPWGPHSHVTLYVFGCFCRLTTVQRKKGSGFCRRRVITWAASHREGGLLHQSRRQGQRLSDQAKLTRTAEGTKRGTEGA